MPRVISAPHPLAAALIERLQSRHENRVLDLATGSGRNAEALRRSGLVVATVEDSIAMSDRPLGELRGPFTAVISSHGFLHGDLEALAARVACVAGALEPRGLLYATFGSTRDARFGQGRQIDEATFAPVEGDESGVPHVYFDRKGLRRLLLRYFVIESLKEVGVDEVAGSWAHPTRSLRGAMHWFSIARRR